MSIDDDKGSLFQNKAFHPGGSSVEYSMVWMGECKSITDPCYCLFKTWLQGRETPVPVFLLLLTEHSEARANGEGLRAETALKPAHFGSYPDSHKN